MKNSPLSGSLRVAAATAVMASMLLLNACSPAPTSTYTNAAGESVTVSWKDYPAYAKSDPEELLQAPLKEEAESVSAALLEEVRTALAAEFGFSWASSGEAGWYPGDGNGYGGKVMTTTYNSVSWDSNKAPADTAGWDQIVDIVNGVTTAHGLGSVNLSPSTEDLAKDPAWRDELLEKYGTADPKKLFWRFGTADGGSQWLSLNIVNVDRDSTGEAAKEYAQLGLPPRSISLSYGVTTLSKADFPAFKQAIKPFTGLTPPEPTTSD